MVCSQKDNEAVIVCSRALRANLELLGQINQDSAAVIKILSDILSAQGLVFTQEVLVGAQRRIQEELDRNAARFQPILY